MLAVGCASDPVDPTTPPPPGDDDFVFEIGQPVDIHVDAYPGIDFKGHVDSIQRGAGQAFALLPPQNATGNYVKVVQRVPVRIAFDAQNGPDPRRYPIGPGMSVVPTVKVR